jgi:protein-L-isoaspartate O-methyltransferase
VTSATTKAPERVRWAVDLLDVRPADHVLEIGCGPGYAVALLCERLTRGTITAIDRSAIAVARTRERNAACIAAGRARIEKGTLTDAALDRRFRTVFAINVNAFWTDPPPSLAALGRLLDRQGKAYLVYEPPTERGLRYMREWLPARLEEHNFRVAAVEIARFRASHGIAIVGRPS